MIVTDIWCYRNLDTWTLPTKEMFTDIG
jgi:multidrug resistance protein, MATE family